MHDAALGGESGRAGMWTEDVRELPDRYATSAARALALGFDGVQVHAAHGFLLSRLLSPLFDRGTEGHGGSIDARCRVVVEVLDRVRSVVGPAFPIGIKINATDQPKGGLTQEDALRVVRILDGSAVDLIDVSGGTCFPGAKASS